MAQATCVVCQQSFDESALVFGDRGRICTSCEVDVKVDAEERDDQLALIIGPPVLVVCGFLAYCVPFVGVLIGIIVSANAMGAGLMAVQRGFRLRGEPTADPSQVTLLLVSGGISAALGLAELAVGMLLAVLFVTAVLMG